MSRIQNNSSYSPVAKLSTQGMIFNPCQRFSLDLCEQVNSTSTIEMPKLKGVTLSAPHDIKAFYRLKDTTAKGIWAHCYTDDSRLMQFLYDPYHSVKQLVKHEAVLGLDLSIKPEMPWPLVVAISYYNKLISAFWQHCGITVIQNVVWAKPNSYDICFDGYAKNATVAVNSTGIGKDKRSRYLWEQGYEAMLECLHPSLIIRYGAKHPCERTGISVYYENDNKKAARYGR